MITSHIAAMYGVKNHKFFDPNVLYDDEELRKVVELLVGAFIFTGQENPEGAKHALREDFLKKLATAEGILGRLPYAIVSKMFYVVGWKRMELNKMFRFSGCV